MRNMLTFMIPWMVGLAVGFKVFRYVFLFRLLCIHGAFLAHRYHSRESHVLQIACLSSAHFRSYVSTGGTLTRRRHGLANVVVIDVWREVSARPFFRVDADGRVLGSRVLRLPLAAHTFAVESMAGCQAQTPTPQFLGGMTVCCSSCAAPRLLQLHTRGMASQRSRCLRHGDVWQCNRRKCVEEE
jgi:hypothetical protein